MSTPLLTWSVIVGLLVITTLIRLTRAVYVFVKGHGSIIEIGTEREEFFIPGDYLHDRDYDYEEL
ncbi:MAG: hypothetical protein Q4E63_01765 [Prevotellaceae bacterium]|nr:hypothetical protein [Prevotellaceae bacterium]MDO4931370.1 hypothetical protein [Prevotellaceae bacterium]